MEVTSWPAMLVVGIVGSIIGVLCREAFSRAQLRLQDRWRARYESRAARDAFYSEFVRDVGDPLELQGYMSRLRFKILVNLLWLLSGWALALVILLVFNHVSASDVAVLMVVLLLAVWTAWKGAQIGKYHVTERLMNRKLKEERGIAVFDTAEMR